MFRRLAMECTHRRISLFYGNCESEVLPFEKYHEGDIIRTLPFYLLYLPTYIYLWRSVSKYVGGVFPE